ncbi:hypothetical protein NH340_JMT01115 [Sarcoptes scabiei]|nr:hypothetical protein NH340_JMT01115 [Sarcoptes scabiei]
MANFFIASESMNVHKDVLSALNNYQYCCFWIIYLMYVDFYYATDSNRHATDERTSKMKLSNVDQIKSGTVAFPTLMIDPVYDSVLEHSLSSMDEPFPTIPVSLHPQPYYSSGDEMGLVSDFPRDSLAFDQYEVNFPFESVRMQSDAVIVDPNLYSSMNDLSSKSFLKSIESPLFDYSPPSNSTCSDPQKPLDSSSLKQKDNRNEDENHVPDFKLIKRQRDDFGHSFAFEEPNNLFQTQGIIANDLVRNNAIVPKINSTMIIPKEIISKTFGLDEEEETPLPYDPFEYLNRYKNSEQVPDHSAKDISDPKDLDQTDQEQEQNTESDQDQETDHNEAENNSDDVAGEDDAANDEEEVEDEDNTPSDNAEIDPEDPDAFKMLHNLNQKDDEQEEIAEQDNEQNESINRSWIVERNDSSDLDRLIQNKFHKNTLLNILIGPNHYAKPSGESSYNMNIRSILNHSIKHQQPVSKVLKNFSSKHPYLPPIRISKKTIPIIFDYQLRRSNNL